MWSPTHVQVIVQRAKNLRTKGKHGTNDTYVTIQLGKEKFQTSVQEKTITPEWHEECELLIPDGNTSAITLAVFHRNFVGLDKFLGRVDIPLQELDVYDRPRNKFYPLRGKPNKSDGKPRGELEVCFAFVVKSVTGSLIDLSKKPRKGGSLPLKMVHNVGGSLMNLAGKEKLSLQNLKHSIGGKLSDKLPRKKGATKNPNFIEEKDTELDDQSLGEDFSDIDAVSNSSSGHIGDTHIITSNGAELNDKSLSTRNDHLSNSNMMIAPPAAAIAPSAVKNHSNLENSKEATENHKNITVIKETVGSKITLPDGDSQGNLGKDTKSARMQTKSSISSGNSNIQREKQIFQQHAINERTHVKLPPQDVISLYEAMTKEELVELLCKQSKIIENQQCQISDLEDYIDNLLVRVMDSTPRILQNPYKCKSYCY